VKLERLTSEQEALLPVVRDEWLAHGLSTEPADRAKAEAGVAAAYREAGLEPPRIIVWLDSPFAGCVGSWMLTQVRDQVRGQVWGQVGDQVWDQVRDQVWGQVWGQVGGQVWGQVGDQVGDQVWGQVGGAIYGQHDAGWLSFYDVFRRMRGVAGPERLVGLSAVARSAGWWWPFRGAAVLTERHDVLHRDAQGRLHCATGPAVTYPDGFAVHAWHGVRVPADLIEAGWDTTRILREGNAEVRRCAIERLGWDRFVADAGLAQVGESAPDPGNPGNDLALYDVPERIYDAPVRVLLCTNGSPERDGTRRRFGLTTPGHISDPIEAAAWTFGVAPSEYLAMERAT
jgi:hypothetical protein